MKRGDKVRRKFLTETPWWLVVIESHGVSGQSLTIDKIVDNRLRFVEIPDQFFESHNFELCHTSLYKAAPSDSGK